MEEINGLTVSSMYLSELLNVNNMKHINLSQSQESITGKLIYLLYPYLNLIDEVKGNRAWGGCMYDGDYHTLWFVVGYISTVELDIIMDLFIEEYEDRINNEVLALFRKWIIRSVFQQYTSQQYYIEQMNMLKFKIKK